MSQTGRALGLLLWLAICSALGEAPRPDPVSKADREGLAERLQAAVRHGDAKEVDGLLARGADPNAVDTQGNPPLFYAVWSGVSAIASSLIDHGADVNFRNGETGGTALLYGVIAGRESAVRLLLAKNASIALRFDGGQSILHIAAARSSTAILQALIAAYADLAATDQNNNTPLDEAVSRGRLSAVLVLLSSGADVNRSRTSDGRSALHEACAKGFATLIEPLISAGANPLQSDRFGLSPLDLAVDYKNVNAVRVLLHLKVDSPALRKGAESIMESAAVRGQTGIAKVLIQAGLPINQPTAAGSTYLSDAALKGRKEMVQLLLDQGADVNAKNRGGSTALQDAALGGDPETVALLLDRGARIDERNPESEATALMIAASLGRSSVLAILLQRGANPTLRDRLGRSALDRARDARDPVSVRLLEAAIAHYTHSLNS
jgi:ankyrin repeat protein